MIETTQLGSFTVNNAIPLPYLLDRKTAAAMISVSVRSIDYLIAEGRLKPRRIGGRVLIAREELLRFASEDRPKPMVPIM